MVFIIIEDKLVLSFEMSDLNVVVLFCFYRLGLILIKKVTVLKEISFG